MPQWTSWSMDLQACWRRAAVATDAARVPSATDPRTGPALAPGRKPAPSLTRRASLNVAASLLDYSAKVAIGFVVVRSEEHTSELQSLTNLVCRLLLEKKKEKIEKKS